MDTYVKDIVSCIIEYGSIYGVGIIFGFIMGYFIGSAKEYYEK